MAIRVIHQASGLNAGLIQALSNVYAAQSQKKAAKATKKAVKSQNRQRIGAELAQSLYGAADTYLGRASDAAEKDLDYRREAETDVRKSKLRREETTAIETARGERGLALEDRRAKNDLARQRDKFQQEQKQEAEQLRAEELKKRLGGYKKVYGPKKRAQLAAIREEIEELDSMAMFGEMDMEDYIGLRQALESEALSVQPDYTYEDPADTPTWDQRVAKGQITYPSGSDPKNPPLFGIAWDEKGNPHEFDFRQKPSAGSGDSVGPWSMIGVDEKEWSKQADAVIESMIGPDGTVDPSTLDPNEVIQKTYNAFRLKGYGDAPAGAAPRGAGGLGGATPRTTPAGADVPSGGWSGKAGMEKLKAAAAASAPEIEAAAKAPQNVGRPPKDWNPADLNRIKGPVLDQVKYLRRSIEASRGDIK